MKASVTVHVDMCVLSKVLDRIADADLTSGQQDRLEAMIDNPSGMVRVEQVGRHGIVLYPSDELFDLIREVRK